MAGHELELVGGGEYALSIISARAGLLPQTLKRQMDRHLPSTVEQALYLRIASSVRIRPSSLALMLRAFAGSPLRVGDEVDVPVGKNLTFNRLQDVVALVLDTITLTHENGAGCTMSIRNATRLVAAYGPEQVEDVLDSLVRGIPSESDAVRARGVAWFCSEGLDMIERLGEPYPLDVEVWLDDHPHAKRRMYRYAGVNWKEMR